MTGFGEALRFERERRGISLHALSAETKVQPRHFLALEQDAFGELPGGVFRRGILRAYLHALELEEQEWVPRFDQCFGGVLTGGQHAGGLKPRYVDGIRRECAEEPFGQPPEKRLALAWNSHHARGNRLELLGALALRLACACGTLKIRSV